jgi:hypothetical protein
MVLAEWWLKNNLVRLLALARKEKGALGQLGWFGVDLQNLAISGKRRVPWLTYGAIDFIEHSISPKARVLELGGGSSTAFWVDRGNPLTTVETNPDWAKKIQDTLGVDPGLFKLIVTPMESEDELCELEGELFDVILNDFVGGIPRHELAAWIVKHVSKDGYIIWDNSDRVDCRPALESLRQEGFEELAFFGLGPGNSYAFQTSILSKRFQKRDWAVPSRQVINY